MSSIKDLSVSYTDSVIPALEAEIRQLRIDKEQLLRRVKELTEIKNITPEELICVEQINILQNRSAQRELSLEEVKKLDYLIKNLRLIKEQSTANLASATYRDVTEEDLVAIASQPED